MTFGARLKEALKARDATQQWLADNVGRTKGAVSQWANGAGEPDLRTLATICDLLGVSADYLVRGVVTPHLSERAIQVAIRFETTSPETQDALAKIFGPAVPDERVSQFLKPAPRLAPPVPPKRQGTRPKKKK